MHPRPPAPPSASRKCFNIRSFGSWNASSVRGNCRPGPYQFQYPLFRIVECIKDKAKDRVRRLLLFQYPLFRIVECICPFVNFAVIPNHVSISALSDRGMHPDPGAALEPTRNMFQYPLFRIVECIHRCRHTRYFAASSFNIRSFGSWNASNLHKSPRLKMLTFQYPLFRIVECIPPALGDAARANLTRMLVC